jgi:uncharacterized lipoprotein YajG
MKIKLIFLNLIMFVSGCTSQSITISTSIPPPLVISNSDLRVVSFFNNNVNNYQFKSEVLEKTDNSWEINFQDTQKNIFTIILNSFFDNYNISDNFDEISDASADLIIGFNLESFELLTPQIASNDKYSIWIKYKINIYDQKKDLIQNWSITGYGEQLTGAFKGNDAILNAISLALRDVGANLTIKLENDMQELLNLVQ